MLDEGTGREQFAAIPIRAMGDTRLSAADFRVLRAVACFDRLGRNGYGCIVDPRRLAEIASVDYSGIARHTGRLKAFGYLAVGRSPSDRRKRIYRLIYDGKSEVPPTPATIPARARRGRPGSGESRQRWR